MDAFYQDPFKFKACLENLWNYPIHYHSDIEILLVKKGILNVRVEGIDYAVNEDEALLVMPFQLHETHSKNPLVERLAFHPSLLEEYPELDMKPLNPVIHFKDECDAVLAHAIMGKLIQTQDVNSRTVIKLLNAFSSLICESTEWTSNVTSSDEMQNTKDIQKILYYCQLHNFEDISVDSVSVATGISGRRISNLINNTMHMGFREYINSLRIEKAKRLLLQEDLSINVIASMCGFVTTRTFYRLFSEDTGMSPTNYKKAHKQ